MDVKQFYDAIGGNYQRALETMMNDEFVKRMLLKFLNSSSYSDLLEAFRNKDIQTIFNVTHMLKGVAGNLSLTPLQLEAAAVCEIARNAFEYTAELDIKTENLISVYELINSNLKQLC